MSRWEDVGSGIMLWKPTVEAATEKSRSSLEASNPAEEIEGHKYGSSHAASPDAVLPSIEENLRAKLHIYNELFITSDRAASTTRDTPASSQIVATSYTSSKEREIAQLDSFATPSSSSSSRPDSQHLVSSPISHSSTTTLIEAEYDSDRTDFLEFPETPCPKSTSRVKQTTGRASHHFQHRWTSKRQLSLRRRLNFGTPTIPKTSQLHQTMRPIEYSPVHCWSLEEDEFLCCLWRWYQRNLRDFARVFNEHFGLSLKQRQITTRFESHLRLYGPRAFKVYRSVFAVPFDDPQDTYRGVRRRIESIASENLIPLCRLEVEQVSPSGRARMAKSRSTRRIYRSFVKKASEEERLVPARDDIQVAPRSFGRVALRTAELESSEYFTDSEEVVGTSLASDNAFETSSSRSDEMPSLAFRVYDANSKGGVNSDNGSIISEGLALWNGPTPPAPNGHIVDILLNNHMSMTTGGTSFYLSVSTSLLQVFNKAANMVQPRIAIISLQHKSLSAPGKVMHAMEVLKKLKKLGQARWALRYRGYAEFLIFGDIPSDCIIRHLPLADLINLSDRHGNVNSLLHLHEFRPGLRTLAVSKELAKKGITLNVSSGNAMAIFACLFGLDGTPDLSHISAFAGRVTDGFSITKSTPEETNAAAVEFAATLASPLHSKQDVAKAFLLGFQNGIETLNYFAKRRRSA
ncbi:hypothetical protein DE146DRAFT_424561 [Phaeosphaeria sp. MPI-PUGE-AT-0046c]|nr:hypothetical protein DE146DRAFT_424561 [Phaeosphaeria sp. MPI-PUGE-AT-0046c]